MSFPPLSLDLDPTGGVGTRPGAAFPVVESARLVPLPGGLLRRPRRRMAELPELTGGSVLVFQVDDRFVLAPVGRAMLSSRVAVQASMATVVVISAQQVHVVATMAATDIDIQVVLRAAYLCRVLDPVRVLETGCWDVRVDLRQHLLGDAKTRMLATRVDLADNPEVSQRILARTLARDQLEPPHIPGMEVKMASIDLHLRRRDAAEWGQPERRSDDVGTHDPFVDPESGGTDRPRDRFA